MKKISRRNFFRLVFAGSAAAALSACGASDAVASTVSPAAGSFTTASLSLSTEEYPVTNGSTAAAPLLAEMLHEITGLSLEDAQSSVSAYATASVWEWLAVFYDSSNPDLFASLILAYPASVEVQKEMRQAGIEVETTPVSQDALVFLTDAENPVENLTQEQLRDIYTGKLTNWKDVGGKDVPILPRQAESTSAAQTMFLQQLMQDTAPAPAATELVPNDCSYSDVVCSYDGSAGEIGFGIYHYIQHMCAQPGIKLLTVDGIAPSDKTLTDGSYPLCCALYAAIRAQEPEGSATRRLYEWICGEEGARCIETAGYLPAPATDAAQS